MWDLMIDTPKMARRDSFRPGGLELLSLDERSNLNRSKKSVGQFSLP
jgi:hypothetical protein